MVDNNSTFNYKQVRDELDQLVSELESEDLDIDTAIKVYEQAEKLIAQLEEHLHSSKNKITKLMADK